MKKNLFFTLATAALLASCSSENDELFNTTPEGQSDELTEIKLSATSLSVDADASQKAATRAAFEGTISSSNKLLALVPASAAGTDYTDVFGGGSSHGTIEFADQNNEFGYNTPKYYPVDGSNVYFCGLYPSEGWTSISTTASYIIDGKSDVMHAHEVNCNKLKLTVGTPALEFNHLLTKLDIIAKGDDAVQAAWGKITALKLTKVLGTTLESPKRTLKVTLTDGTTVYEGDTGELSCYLIADDSEVAAGGKEVTIENNDTKKAYVLAPAVTAVATSHEYELEVTTEKIKTPVTVKVNLKTTAGTEDFTGDTQGKAFTVTLNFKATEIKVKAEVAQWEDGGKANVDIQ